MRIWLLLVAFIMSSVSVALPVTWQNLAQGLDYTTVFPYHGNRMSKIHAFRIDPKQYRFNLVFARDYNMNSAFVQQLSALSNAMIAINGGFFSPNFKPLGLRIQDGHTRNHLKNISWWGVFYIRHDVPHIVAKRHFSLLRGIEIAVQAGPRLLINGYIPSLKPGMALRSAIGITRTHRVILVTTEGTLLSTLELAEIFKLPNEAGGFNCYNALNLDGGSSAQMFAHVDSFRLNIVNLGRVTDAIIIVPK